MIAAGEEAWLNQKILAYKILVFVGLISYPLYLWHWSLLAFCKIISAEPAPIIRLAIIGISIVLAWLTYKFIEQPIRFGKKTPLKPILLMAFLVVLGLTGSYMYTSGGLPNRAFINEWQLLTSDLSYDTSKMAYHACPSPLKNSKPELNYCLQSKASPPVAVVFGDSHADHIFHGIAKMDSTHSWLLAGNSSCVPVSGIDIAGGDVKQCQERIAHIIHYLKSEPGIRLVVLSFFGNIFKDEVVAADHVQMAHGSTRKMIITATSDTHLKNKLDLFQYGLENVVTELEKAGKKIVIVTDVPELPFFSRDCIPRRLFNRSAVGHCSIAKQM